MAFVYTFATTYRRIAFNFKDTLRDTKELHQSSATIFLVL